MPATAFQERRFEVHADPPDDRDVLYSCSPDTPPETIPLEEFQRFAGPVQSQGREPSCCGMALAGVANYMMRRHWSPDADPVSPRMMYEMARRHDHLPDEEEGSNPRGAVKGWYKHGVCSEELWPYTACTKHGRLTFARVVDAARRLMRSYARVDGSDMEAMKWAIAEHGVLFANSVLHEGWREPDAHHVIPYHPGELERGGHAFMIVGYDERGFWIQNSWSDDWGRDGCAILTYDDWEANGVDVWVAAVDVETLQWGERLALGEVDGSKQGMFVEMWPHVVVVGDDGRLARQGSYGAAPEDLVGLIDHFEEVTADWEHPRLVIVAGAGITRTYDAVAAAEKMRSELLGREIYPVFVMWQSDWMAPLAAVLERLAEKRGGLDLEDQSARLVVRDGAEAVRERADFAVQEPDGAAHRLVDRVLEAFVRRPFEIHLVAHGVGDVLMSGLARYLADEAAMCGARINSCTLWAPASTVARFDATYRPLLDEGVIDHIGLFVLDEKRERADAIGPYEGSVLHLLADVLRFEKRTVLGLEETLDHHDALRKLRKEGDLDVVVAPTRNEDNPLRRSEATTHAGFITDEATIRATLGRILGSGDALAAELESRDPLVRAKAVHRAKLRAEKLEAERAAIDECDECRALRERAGVG